MKWLGSRRGKRYATGGLVNIERAPLLTAGCSGVGYLMPTSVPEPDETQPIGIVEFNGVMTEEQMRQFCNSVKISTRPLAPNSASKLCACDLVIYSKHRCGRDLNPEPTVPTAEKAR